MVEVNCVLADISALCGKPLVELSEAEIVNAWKVVYSKLVELSPFDKCYLKYRGIFDTIVDYYYNHFDIMGSTVLSEIEE